MNPYEVGLGCLQTRAADEEAVTNLQPLLDAAIGRVTIKEHAEDECKRQGYLSKQARGTLSKRVDELEERTIAASLGSDEAAFQRLARAAETARAALSFRDRGLQLHQNRILADVRNALLVARIDAEKLRERLLHHQFRVAVAVAIRAMMVASQANGGSFVFRAEDISAPGTKVWALQQQWMTCVEHARELERQLKGHNEGADND